MKRVRISLMLIIGAMCFACEVKDENFELINSTDNAITAAALTDNNATVLIDNNSIWNDVNGNEINAMGGCIVQDGNTFHWIGPEFRSGSYHFHAVNHYTSTDLKNWTKQAPILTPGMPEASKVPIYSSTWVGRPWVMKHSTNNYVMWIEAGKNGGSYRNRYGVFYASDIGGPWTFDTVYSYLPDRQNVARALGDMGGYHDTSTGSAYILYTYDTDAAHQNEHQAIVKLTPNFRRAVKPAQGGVVTYFKKSLYYGNEAAAIFKKGSTYYFTMSETRGWRPSNTYYRMANSVGHESTWSSPMTMAQLNPSGNNYSFRTQHDFVLPVTGSLETTYIYVGDRWSLFHATDYNGAIGRQAWFPLSFDTNGRIVINAPNFAANGGDWYLNVDAGTWGTTPPATPSPNLIVNGDFSNDYNNWTKTGTAFITTASAEVRSAPKASNSYSTNAYTTTLSNTVSNCTAGIYTAKLWSRSKVINFTTRRFEVYVDDVKVKELNLSTGTNWAEFVINDISVPANATVKLQITLNAPATAWTQFDDFSLVKH